MSRVPELRVSVEREGNDETIRQVGGTEVSAECSAECSAAQQTIPAKIYLKLDQAQDKARLFAPIINVMKGGDDIPPATTVHAKIHNTKSVVLYANEIAFNATVSADKQLPTASTVSRAVTEVRKHAESLSRANSNLASKKEDCTSHSTSPTAASEYNKAVIAAKETFGGDFTADLISIGNKIVLKQADVAKKQQEEKRKADNDTPTMQRAMGHITTTQYARTTTGPDVAPTLKKKKVVGGRPGTAIVTENDPQNKQIEDYEADDDDFGESSTSTSISSLSEGRRRRAKGLSKAALISSDDGFSQMLDKIQASSSSKMDAMQQAVQQLVHLQQANMREQEMTRAAQAQQLELLRQQMAMQQQVFAALLQGAPLTRASPPPWAAAPIASLAPASARASTSPTLPESFQTPPSALSAAMAGVPLATRPGGGVRYAGGGGASTTSDVALQFAAMQVPNGGGTGATALVADPSEFVIPGGDLSHGEWE